MKRFDAKLGLTLILSLAITGCANQTGPEPAAVPVAPTPSRVHADDEFARHMAAARQAFEKREWDAAMVECAAMFRLDPTDVELQSLYQAARTAQLAERSAHLAAGAQLSEQQAKIETKEKELLPATYGTRRPFQPMAADQRTQETAIELLLKKPVSMDLEDAELSVILSELSKKAGIQFIADQSLIAEKKLTVKLENSPLKEVIDYLSRNLQLTFYAGENILWVASAEGQEAQSLVPMETRIYHLRKGVMLPEADSIQATESMPSVSTGSRLGTPRTRSFGGGTTGAAAAGGGAQGDTKLEQVIDTFVPKPEGSNFFFHRDAHVLIARNTRENLRLVEQIIEALDITPQQVLIEARFIEVGVDDLRELGIEWALNSDYAVTRRAGGRSETIIKSGSGVTFPTPATTPGGFNLTYTGVLTDPMFQAVLHALHTSGKSKTLAVPRVTTVNNIAAKIRVGQDFRYFEQFERQSVLSSVTGVGGTPVYTSELVPVGTPTLEELGIQLNVLPSVGADSEEITLVLAPQNKDFVRFEEFTFGPTVGGTLTNGNSLSGGTIRLPIFNVSEITTRVIVRSGETVVMGGLVRTSTQRQTNKFPILGDIPVLGALFRRTSNDETRSNLLIFVTATLIGYSGESLVPVR